MDKFHLCALFKSNGGYDIKTENKKNFLDKSGSLISAAKAAAKAGLGNFVGRSNEPGHLPSVRETDAE